MAIGGYEGIIDENLKTILKQSISNLRSEDDNEIKQKYKQFQFLYEQLMDNSRQHLSQINALVYGPLRKRGKALEQAYFNLETSRTLAKLKAFTNNYTQEDMQIFLQLQQCYEELVALILHLPMPYVLILYTDQSGKHIPIMSKDFNDYVNQITNERQFGKGVKVNDADIVRLKSEYIRNQAEQIQALAESSNEVKTNLELFSKHYDFFFDTIQYYAKKHARQSNITEAFFNHFYTVDYTADLSEEDANFLACHSILYRLAENTLEHFGGVSNIFILYHMAQGNDPTFTGQDVVTKFVNVQIKSVIDDPKKGLSLFDLAKNNLITNFYLFVSTVLMDSSIDINEAAEAGVLFFMQENKDIKAADAIDKYIKETLKKECIDQLYIKK